MHEVMTKVQEICNLKDRILDYTKSGIECDKLDISQAGQTVDMVKDLCDAEKNLWKAAYYKSVVKAMEEYDGDDIPMDDEGRMGYDHWRTSSGRYAPKGTGHWTPIHGKRGYNPTPYYPDPNMMAEGDWRGNRMEPWMDGKMGYSDPDMAKIMHDERHGRPYKDWQLARKHYTETKSEGDKHQMSQHAKEHLNDTVVTLKEMWDASDPELREKMKKDLTTLMAAMK